MTRFYQPEKADSEDNNLVSVNCTVVENDAVTIKFTEVCRYRHSVTMERSIKPTTEWKIVGEQASASGEGYFPPQWGKPIAFKQSSASEEVFVTVHADGTEKVTPIKEALARTWSSAEVN